MKLQFMAEESLKTLAHIRQTWPQMRASTDDIHMQRWGDAVMAWCDDHAAILSCAIALGLIGDAEWNASVVDHKSD